MIDCIFIPNYEKKPEKTFTREIPEVIPAAGAHIGPADRSNNS